MKYIVLSLIKSVSRSLAAVVECLKYTSQGNANLPAITSRNSELLVVTLKHRALLAPHLINAQQRKDDKKSGQYPRSNEGAPIPGLLNIYTPGADQAVREVNAYRTSCK